LLAKKIEPIEAGSSKRKLKRQDTGATFSEVTSFGASQKENSPLKTVKKCPEFPKDENGKPTPSPTKKSATKRSKLSA
jgi:hypothetical protein